MDDWTLPERLRLAPARDRIRWHRERVSRTLPVFDFLDELDTGLEPLEVRERLAEVRQEREQVEHALRLRQCPRVAELEQELSNYVAKARAALSQRAALIQRIFGKPGQHAAAKPELEALKAEEDAMIKAARAVEEALCQLCRSLGGCPYEENGGCPHRIVDELLPRR